MCVGDARSNPDLAQTESGSPRKVRELGTVLAPLADDAAAVVLSFSPDSTRLVFATPAARVVILALGESPQLLKVFEQHTGAPTEPRAVAGKLANGHAHTNGVANGHAHPRESSPAMDVDEDLSAPAATTANAAESSHGIVALAVSGDAQWLASVDRARRLHVFSLDSLQVRRSHSSPR